MIRRQPRSTLTDTLFPSTTLFRSFFINCNGAIYPLYAEPAEIPAQTVTLTPGRPQLARANEELLGPLVEEERAVSVTLAMLQDRVPADRKSTRLNSSH